MTIEDDEKIWEELTKIDRDVSSFIEIEERGLIERQKTRDKAEEERRTRELLEG